MFIKSPPPEWDDLVARNEDIPTTMSVLAASAKKPGVRECHSDSGCDGQPGARRPLSGEAESIGAGPGTGP